MFILNSYTYLVDGGVMKVFEAKKILVAIEVNSTLPEAEQNLFKMLRYFSKDQSEITPVCIVNSLEITGQFNLIKKAIEEHLAKIVGMNSVKEPVILMQKNNYWGSIADKAETLLQYANDEKFDLIGATAHTNEPLINTFTGSFIETLCAQSEIPLLLISSSSEFKAEISRILIPSALNHEEIAFYKQLITSGQLSNKDILFYHHIYDQDSKLYQHWDFLKKGHLAYINNLKIEYQHHFDEIAKIAEGKVKSINLQLDISEQDNKNEIQTFTQNYAPDLILLNEKSTLLKRMFHASTTRYLLASTNAPIISCRQIHQEGLEKAPSHMRPDWLTGFPESRDVENL